ncbi:MAG TPA: bifunctional phosphopantothenoylcysteine decarboxylase/phosphopantothenate--cysteine ligase CoaBC [bacterium]|nr:bifunctional phosphopantothenoylcysteine decarboxylase/phosphopantothenate--cysteine ligase CoaBC [bacterium]
MQGKHITLAVTGAIAAYKAIHLLRLFREAGAEVQVIGTEHSLHFVGRETWEALSGRPPLFGLWETPDPSKIPHIMLGQEVDLVVVAPATANMLAKAACGIADDLVSTVLLAATAPVLFAPCMNTAMWEHPATRRNVETLAARPGIHFVQCAEGKLACGTEGKGRLAEPPTIFEMAEFLLTPKRPERFRWLITAGATREYIDPVRFLSNGSSGLMGRSIADAAWRLGGEVTLVTGPVADTTPRPYPVHTVTSAAEMATAVNEQVPLCDILVMSAAVADHAPVKSVAKQKKAGGDISLTLHSTPDILTGTIPLMRPDALRVGFAAETEDLIKNARGKRERKKLDLIVANLVSMELDPLGSQTNRVTLITADAQEELPLMPKRELGTLLAVKIHDMAARKRSR